MKIDLTIALLATMAPCLAAQADAFDPVEKTVETTLDQIRQHPDAFKGVAVEFEAQFCSIGKVANPFFTRFVPSLFTNFYAWSGAQPIWRRDEYDDVCGTLFLSKDSEQLQELYQLDTYTRVRVVGVVRNTFQSKPWIEVIRFEEKLGKVNAPTLAHLFRGETHMQRRQWNRAVSELSLAAAGSVPGDVLAAVHENLGTCYLRLGESDKAVVHLDHAVRLRGDSATNQLRDLWSVARNSPEQHLDREVEAVEIGDFERPMWEAFADASADDPTTAGF